MKTREKRRENARGKTRLPLLAGRANVSSKTFTQIDERERLRSDYLWISNERTYLSQMYPNKFVAVENGNVVLAETDVHILVKRLKERGLRPDNVAIEFLSDNPVCLLL
jgi:hypothetical protein